MPQTQAQSFLNFQTEIWEGDSAKTKEGGVIITQHPLYPAYYNALKSIKDFSPTSAGHSKDNQYKYFKFSDNSTVSISRKGNELYIPSKKGQK